MFNSETSHTMIQSWGGQSDFFGYRVGRSGHSGHQAGELKSAAQPEREIFPMANIHTVYIQGRAPFDIAQPVPRPGTDWIARDYLGLFNGPCYGLDVEWGESSLAPNENGGHMTFYEFIIAGDEAIWHSGVVDIVRVFEDAGSIIDEAWSIDLEYDRMRNKEYVVRDGVNVHASFIEGAQEILKG